MLAAMLRNVRQMKASQPGLQWVPLGGLAVGVCEACRNMRLFSLPASWMLHEQTTDDYMCVVKQLNCWWC